MAAGEKTEGKQGGDQEEVGENTSKIISTFDGTDAREAAAQME